MALCCGFFLCLAACGDDDPQGERGDRPGVETPPCEPVSLMFVPSRMDVEVTDRPSSGTVTVNMTREGDRLPDTIYALHSDDDAAALAFPPTIHFGQGAKTGAISVAYSLNLNVGSSYTASISADDARVELCFFRPDGWSAPAAGLYRSLGTATAVTVRSRKAGDITEYEAVATDFRRVITVTDNGMVRLRDASGGAAPGSTLIDSQDYGDAAVRSRFPIYSAGSTFDSDNRIFGLSVTETAADGFVCPHYDFLRIDVDYEWEDMGYGNIVDGWLIGVVSFEMRPPADPATQPWPVFVQRNRQNPKLLRICALYREASPLSVLNSASGESYLIVALSGESNAEIAPTASGFVNSDLFNGDFTIGGRGTAHVNAEGLMTVTIDPVEHNGAGVYGTPWARQWPTVLTIASGY